MAIWSLGKGLVLIGGYLYVLFFLIYKKFLSFVVCCIFNEKGNTKFIKTEHIISNKVTIKTNLYSKLEIFKLPSPSLCSTLYLSHL